MTKKSQSRMRRDEFKKSNTAWDDLRVIYQENQSKLNAVVMSVKSFFEVDNIASFIPAGQEKYTIDVVNALASDVRNFQTRLNDIYKQHNTRSGQFDFNDTDYVRLISLGDQYIQFSMDYDTILAPVYRQALAVIQSIDNNVTRIANTKPETDEAPAQEEPVAVAQEA